MNLKLVVVWYLWIGRIGTCQWTGDGICDEPALCANGTDSADCSSHQSQGAATCAYTNDGVCDEGTYCTHGTDVADCAANAAGSSNTNTGDTGADSTPAAGDGGTGGSVTHLPSWGLLPLVITLLWSVQQQTESSS